MNDDELVAQTLVGIVGTLRMTGVTRARANETVKKRASSLPLGACFVPFGH
jgi:hypothetical protein